VRGRAPRADYCDRAWEKNGEVGRRAFHGCGLIRSRAPFDAERRERREAAERAALPRAAVAELAMAMILGVAMTLVEAKMFAVAMIMRGGFVHTGAMRLRLDGLRGGEAGGKPEPAQNEGAAVRERAWHVTDGHQHLRGEGQPRRAPHGSAQQMLQMSVERTIHDA
jgi:hypothetical protein